MALAEQKHILKNKDDTIGNNLFSFIFILGIVVCFFKFISDLLAVYGAVNVSFSHNFFCSVCYYFKLLLSKVWINLLFSIPKYDKYQYLANNKRNFGLVDHQLMYDSIYIWNDGILIWFVSWTWLIHRICRRYLFGRISPLR